MTVRVTGALTNRVLIDFEKFAGTPIGVPGRPIALVSAFGIRPINELAVAVLIKCVANAGNCRTGNRDPNLKSYPQIYPQNRWAALRRWGTAPNKINAVGRCSILFVAVLSSSGPVPGPFIWI